MVMMADFGISDPSGISWSDIAKSGVIAGISIGTQYAAKETGTIAPKVPTQESSLPLTLKDVDKQMIYIGIAVVVLLVLFKR